MASIEEVKAALMQAAERGKQHLTEAGVLIQGSTTAAREYVSILG
ncbi:hypothetical protein [Plantactinospora sp. B5E13]